MFVKLRRWWNSAYRTKAEKALCVDDTMTAIVNGRISLGLYFECDHLAFQWFPLSGQDPNFFNEGPRYVIMTDKPEELESFLGNVYGIEIINWG